jgi:DNA-binding MarR family transcriptional regulator
LRQTIHAFDTAMEKGLRSHGLTSPQFGALFVLDAEPGLSAADLARAMGTSPQAANALVAGMTQGGLVERTPHPTHGRVLEIYPTDEGTKRFNAALPFIRQLEADMSKDLDKAELAIVKRWLVDSARAVSTDRRNREQRGSATRPSR